MSKKHSSKIEDLRTYVSDGVNVRHSPVASENVTNNRP